jgi:hypothetical protein
VGEGENIPLLIAIRRSQWFLHGDEFPSSEKSHSTMGNKVVFPFITTIQDLLFWGEKKRKK